MYDACRRGFDANGQDVARLGACIDGSQSFGGLFVKDCADCGACP
jgi:hypothetical protein